MKSYNNGRKMKSLKQQKDKKNLVTCKKQFPDCPEEPNDEDCRTCPHYTK